jgi:hypothetical protein
MSTDGSEADSSASTASSYVNMQIDAGAMQIPIAARGIDNVPGRDGTASVDPIAPPPTVGGGLVGDLLAVALSRCWRELSHRKPRTSVDSLGGIVSMWALEKAA